MSLSDADKKLVEHGAKVRRCIYIAAHEDAAKDVDTTIRQLTGRLTDLSAENKRLREGANKALDMILGIDWEQVALNRSEPCCHTDERGKLCGRSRVWRGHPDQHKFISLYIAARAALGGEDKSS